MRGKTLRSGAAGAALALLAGCAPPFDTTRETPARGTLGEELYRVLCERMHYGETPRDLSFVDGRRACTVGLGASESAAGVGPRTTALAHRRNPMVAALDLSMPRPLHDPLDAYLLRLLPLYGPDGTGRREGDTWQIDGLDGGVVVAEPMLPETTRAIAGQLVAVARDEAALRALSRASQRQGYRPVRVAIGMMRPMLGYDDADAALGHLLRLTREGSSVGPRGAARGEFEAVSDLLRGEFSSAGPSADTRGGTTLDATLDLLFRADPSLATGTPIDLVRRDARGMALPDSSGGALPAPFSDADRDGLADVNADGVFVRGAAPVNAPAPFATSANDGATRDARDRALVSRTDNRPLYRYVDLDQSVVGALTRDLPDLLGAPTYENPTAMRLLRGTQALIGARSAATRDYGGGASVSYQRYDAQGSPLVDLLYAAGALLRHKDADAFIALTRQLMSTENEQLTARLIGEVLRVDAVADRYPGVTMDARSVIWDDVMDVVRRMGEEPGLLDDLVRAFAQLNQPLPSTGLWEPRCAGTVPSRNLSDAFGAYARNRDRLEPPWPTSATRNDRSARGPWNAHVDRRLTQPVDRSQPDTNANRSALARLFHLVDDLNRARLCNKRGARVRIYPRDFSSALSFIPAISVASNIDECALVSVPDAAAIYLRAIAGGGRAVLPMDVPGAVGAIADFARRYNLLDVDATLDSLVERQSHIDGFTSQPTPYAIARLVFNPNPTDFLNELMDPATVRNAGTVTSPPPADRVVRNLHQGTIFAWESYCFYDSIRPLALAFVKHDRHNVTGQRDPHLVPGAALTTMFPRDIDTSRGSSLFADLISAFHRHWATPQSGDYQSRVRCDSCREGAAYSQMDGASRYEPILGDVLDGDLLPTLSTASQRLGEIDVGGGHNGRDALGSLVRALVDTRATAMDGTAAYASPLRYRNGDTMALWSDRNTPVGGVNLFYLFADAFNAMDPLLAADAPRRADWEGARSSLVDLFIAVDGSGTSARFHNPRFGGVSRALTAWLADRVAAHRAAGDLDAWAAGLSTRLSDTLRGAPFAVTTDMLLAIDRDPEARAAILRLTTHLVDGASADGEPSNFATTTTALADLVQALRADGDVDPVLHAFAPAFDRDGGLVHQLLRFLDRARAEDTDRVLMSVLRNAVRRPAGGDRFAREPMTTMADAIAEVNRERPGETTPMSPRDVFFMLREVVSFLTDPSRGMEQIYYIVQHRRLPR